MPLNINFVGDIMLGRGVQSMLENDNALAISVNKIVSQGIPLIANLEAPFSKNGKPFRSKDPHLTFKIDPKYVSFLKNIGLTSATLANNHISDFGQDGIKTTLETLENSGISYTGAGKNISKAIKPIIINDSNKKIAVFSFNAFVPFTVKASKNSYGVARFDSKTVKSALSNLKEDIDGVVLTVHWGIDYHELPVPELINFARKIIDKYPKILAIIGHHPHLQQPVINHKGVPIFCSLGNFIFDEPFKLSRISSILTLTINDGMSVSYKLKYAHFNKNFVMEEISSADENEEINRLQNAYNIIETNHKDYLNEDRRWIKYLIYQTLVYKSLNDLSYLLKNYNLFKIIKKIVLK